MMAEAQPGGVYLVQVITDDREHQIWAVAAPSEEAVDLVLEAIPEGWAVSLLTSRLKPQELEALNLRAGEVRKITK
jgi:hypothetical protein